jgi:hypothetical protein
MSILNLDGAPTDAIKRLMWLSGVREQVAQELDTEWRRAYFTARLEQRLDVAESLRYHSHKRIMAWTRAENEARGRGIRWGDRRG